jgi:hypothetical protein
MTINTPDDVRDFALSALPEEAAAYLSAAILEGEHPPFGQDWTVALWDSRPWLLAHARWRLDERKHTQVRVTVHGRGVRLTDGGGLDAFVVDYYEFDRVLDEWERTR